MVPNTLPNADRLRELFDYNPETGALTWRPRPPDSFRSRAGCAMWTKRFSGKHVCVKGKSYRAQVPVDGKAYPIHRIIYKIMTGNDPIGVIDHINQDHTDNRWANLRDVNVRVNRLNTKARADNALGIKGVFRRGNKYIASVGLRGVSIHLGIYESEAMAMAAHQAAALVTLKAELEDLPPRTAPETPYQPSRSGHRPR